MKLQNKIFIGIGAACLVALSALAGSPTYVSKSAASATASEVIFPSDPNLQIRLVNVSYQSDSNTAVLSFSTGGGAYTSMATNTSSGITNVVNSTAGLVTNNTLVLEHLGVGYSALLVATNSGTNITLNTGGWGITPSIGDNVYQMGTASTVFVGSNGTATAAINGEAIYVGNPGRPVRIQLTPALATNRLNNISARYE